MTSRDSNELSAAAGFSAAAEGSNTWMRTERGQGDADIPQKAVHKPTTLSGSEMSGQQALAPRDSELGQGDSVLGHGDGAQSPAPLVEAVLHTLIEPIKQQFTEELAQRDARIQQLEKKIERLGVVDTDLAAKSSLNVEAQEFVPRFTVQVAAPVQDVNTPCILHPLDEMQQAITYLTDRPGHFDLMMDPLVDSLSMSMYDESTMLEIIEMILVQAIREANFRYTGARMCNFLSQNLTTALGAGNFRQQLLKRCHEEFEKSMKLIANNNVNAEVIGFALFLAELLSNVMDSSNERLKILANALQKILTSLLAHSSDTALRCVVQVLKLSGGILHDIELQLSGGTTPQLDAIFQLVKQVVVQSQCSRNMKAMLLSVIELRASDWGREPDDPPGGSTQTANDALSYSSQVMEPVYNPVLPIDSYPEWYTGDMEPLDGLVEMADGVFVYDDEDDDYEVEANSHGMDDEMTDAYEMFMQQQQNKLLQ